LTSQEKLNKNKIASQKKTKIIDKKDKIEDKSNKTKDVIKCSSKEQKEKKHDDDKTG
jgi:hypothetical protein